MRIFGLRIVANVVAKMSNYKGTLNHQARTLKEVLKNVKVRCSVCHSKMIRVIDLYDDTLIGYSCENCPHYNLLNNDPV